MYPATEWRVRLYVQRHLHSTLASDIILWIEEMEARTFFQERELARVGVESLIF